MKRLSTLFVSALALATFVSTVGSTDIVHADDQSVATVQTAKPSPRGISVFTKGTITPGGSIVRDRGMTIESDGSTRGILELKYEVEDHLEVNLKDHTYTYFKMPEELYDVMDYHDDENKYDFSQSITGSFEFEADGGGKQVIPYDSSKISVVGNHMIRLDNGEHSSLLGQKATTTIEINLGKAVTASHKRIPDTKTAYTFNATTSTDGAFLNWNLVGDADAWCALSEIPSIDPGYGYEKEKPKVNDVYDTDKKVTGTAKAGATVNVYNNDRVLIGHGTAQDNGEYVAKIKDEYLPLEEDDELDVTQDFGLGETNPTIVLVKHKGNEDSSNTYFKTGYWGDNYSYIAIEGQFVNPAFDFSKQSNTQFTLNLKNSQGVVKLPVAGTTTQFNTPEVFDGYQALINSSDLLNSGNLPDGSYSVFIQAVNVNGTTEKPLKTTGGSLRDYKHVWNEMESHVLPGGRQVTFTTAPDGTALINLTTISK